MSSGPVIQGLDTITAAMESNIIPDQEYLLQGSILDGHVDVLSHRLRGLCDNVSGMVSSDQFSERELVFTIRSAQSQPLSLRVRKTGTEQVAKDNSGEF